MDQSTADVKNDVREKYLAWHPFYDLGSYTSLSVAPRIRKYQYFPWHCVRLDQRIDAAVHTAVRLRIACYLVWQEQVDVVAGGGAVVCGGAESGYGM